MKIKEVIVVEGKDDTVRIKLAVDADTIETNGSAINEKIYIQIKHALQKRGVIVFTDPDYPGERIRRLINEHVPGCKHAYLPREKAIGKQGLGIEHAKVDDIRQALSEVYEIRTDSATHIDWNPLLIEYGLLGGSNAKSRRENLSQRLKMGYSNGKQFAKRLNMFEITEAQFAEAMKHVLKEEDSNG